MTLDRFPKTLESTFTTMRWNILRFPGRSGWLGGLQQRLSGSPGFVAVFHPHAAETCPSSIVAGAADTVLPCTTLFRS
jgi:hypothetical protein